MKEEDIRPKQLFEQYLKLSAQDANLCFGNIERIDVDCPGCGSQSKTYSFTKHGFEYATCNSCLTLYQTPRPIDDAFEKFYHNSISSNFWAENFFPQVAETRRERIFLPRVQYLYDYCKSNNIGTDTVIDVGAGYGIFLEEWKKKSPKTKTIAIEPSLPLAKICQAKNMQVVNTVAEKAIECQHASDVVTCFEVLEHIYEPLRFVKTLKEFLKDGGLLMVSTLCVDGFDIQVLWENSNSISPPHHINFLSQKGLIALFKRAGLRTIEITTPGVLDVDIVKNAYKRNKLLLSDNRFLKKIIENDHLANTFQEYLINQKLSSHAWIYSRNIK